MPNEYFQFKQFTVHQEKAAMKVCTDACLFGAWVANIVETERPQIKRVLDIGAGTGLLSLMLAQKSTAQIDAVEIDPAASEQSRENFEQSVFSERLQLIEADIRSFETPVKYDLVVANPPFFKNDLKSENEQRNLALHSLTLSFEELISAAAKRLSKEGIFAILVPFFRADEFASLAKTHRLFLVHQVMVKQTEKHDYFRAMLLFSKVEKKLQVSEMIIKEAGKYSEGFIQLLKDYYLYL